MRVRDSDVAQCVAADLLRLGRQLPEGPCDRSWVRVLVSSSCSRADVARANVCRCVFASFLAAFVLRTRLARLNKQNAEIIRSAGVPEKKGEEGKSEEIWDNDPRYVFMT